MIGLGLKSSIDLCRAHYLLYVAAKRNSYLKNKFSTDNFKL